MQAHFGFSLLKPEWTGSVVTLGVFDGIHLGHQALVRRACQMAEERGVPSIVVTFDRHPLSVLRPESAPLPLASLSQNLAWLAELGPSQAVVIPFDQAMAHKAAFVFLADILREKLRAEAVVVGEDFAFGRGREGTVAWLKDRIETEVIEPVLLDGERVSSSAIRSLVSEGRTEEAARLLTRPYELEGVVVGGQKLGRTLGYPTINLGLASPQALPGDGIYAGECQTPFGLFSAAISVGMRPTVGGSHRTVEAYLLDYPGESLYGRSAALRFLARLRGEEKFSSLEALKEQMARDVEEVRSLAKALQGQKR